MFHILDKIGAEKNKAKKTELLSAFFDCPGGVEFIMQATNPWNPRRVREHLLLKDVPKPIPTMRVSDSVAMAEFVLAMYKHWDIRTSIWANRFTQHQLHWMLKAHNRELKIGIGYDTIQKMDGAAPVMFRMWSPFELSLCSKTEYFPVMVDSVPNFKMEKWIAEIKYHGVRAICHIIPRHARIDGLPMVEFFGRDGEIISQIETSHMEAHLLSLHATTPFVNQHVWLDGELVGGKFKGPSKKSRGQPQKHPTFKIFDIFVGDEWRDADQSAILYPDTLEMRKMNLRAFFSGKNLGGTVDMVSPVGIKSREHLDVMYKKIREKGEEGLVLKNLDKPYMFGRNNSWIKMKPKE